MKIYFAGSIRSGREDAPIYKALIEHLKGYGTVLTEHLGSDLSSKGEHWKTDKAIHDRDLEWLLSSDLLVAEITITSMGVGYEIGRALEHDINVLCLHRPHANLSPMINGNEAITVKAYTTIEEGKLAIDDYLHS